ncbi:MAG: formate/nitrite transporter [Acidobacteria bacterium]|nr:formate/nitrite transporter [Acidobacteriota bacterium]
MRRYLPIVIIGVVLVAVVAGALLLVRSKKTATTAPFVAQGTPAPSTTPPVTRPSVTPENTIPAIPVGVGVAVEEYGDYQCPPCGLLHPEMKKIEQEYGARINFVFRNLPLTQLHKNALAAAQAAEAARLQSRFWEMHDRIYETQDAWKDDGNPRSIFINYAHELGLDVERFTRDMDGTEVQGRLKADRDRADSLAVVGTPTILIEGRQLKVENINGEGIRKGINVMLARKASGQ